LLLPFLKLLVFDLGTAPPSYCRRPRLDGSNVADEEMSWWWWQPWLKIAVVKGGSGSDRLKIVVVSGVKKWCISGAER
jgi:hypothetical protein